MVKRVFGKADGVNILFTPSGDGKWKCSVPANESGQYIVELFAEDMAGNVSYMATALITIDIKKLSVKISWIDFAEDMSVQDIKSMFRMTPDYDCEFSTC